MVKIVTLLIAHTASYIIYVEVVFKKKYYTIYIYLDV